MLHEYNYGVMNPYYTNNVISKWLEEQLRQGDLISDDRVGDLVVREIDKKIEEYNGQRGEQFEKVQTALKLKVIIEVEGNKEVEINEEDRQDQEIEAPPTEEPRIEI